MFEKRLTKTDKLALLIDYAEQAVSADYDFQAEAKEDFLFRNGEQWPNDEKLALADNKRPCLTFNLTKSSIDLVMGLNEDQKVRYRVVPVHNEDKILADILNKIIYRMHEEGEWEQEEDDAFESMAICGRGWVTTDFNYDPKRFGYIKLEKTAAPVHEIFRDPASRRRDLADASYILWERWMTVEDFKIKYPNHKLDPDDHFDQGTFLYEPNVGQLGYDDTYTDIDAATDYDNALDTSWYDKNRRMVRVIHMEYWKTYKRHYVRHPDTGKIIEVTESWSKWKKWYDETYPNRPLEHTTMMDKKVHWIQYTKHEILYDDESPMDYPGFSIVPCFGYVDTSKRTTDTFGIVRLIKDPQREVNKRWSQTLNLLNNQVQPGVFAETDAFVDKDQAEHAMKIPGEIAYVNSGALNKKMIQERNVPAFPNASFTLEEAAQVMIKRISGINPDLHGMDPGRQESGVVVRLRQQQGLVILRPLFKAFKLMRKELYNRVIAMVLKYMPIEQMREIVGKDEVYEILEDENGEPMIHHLTTGEIRPLDDVKNIAYHIELEETQNSATQRTFELSVLMEMQQGGIMVDPLAIIDKIDMSASDKERWAAYIQQQQEAASQQANNEMQMEQTKIEMQHMREMERMKLQHEQAMVKLMLQAKRDEDNDENTDDANKVDLIDAVLRYRSEMARAQTASEKTHIDAAVDLSDQQIKAGVELAKAAVVGEKNKNENGRSESKK